MSDTKNSFLEVAGLWGEIAGVHDACYTLPNRIAQWRRADPRFRTYMDQVDLDVERRPLMFVDRRMAEGDKSATTARLRTTRGPAKSPKQNMMRPPWLINPDSHIRVIEAAVNAIEELAKEGINAGYNPAIHGGM